MSFCSVVPALQSSDLLQAAGALDQLAESLLVYTPDSGLGSVSSILPALLCCASSCMATWPVEGEHEEGEEEGEEEEEVPAGGTGLEPMVLERCMQTLSRLEDLDPHVRPTLAGPASLSVLRRTLLCCSRPYGLEGECSDTCCALLTRLASHYAQSVLRSGCTQAAVGLYIAAGSSPGIAPLSSTARGRCLDLVLASAEAALTREDCAAFLDLTPRLLGMVGRVYTKACSLDSASGLVTVACTPVTPSPTSSACVEVCVRALARFASNQTQCALGHWKTFPPVYGLGDEQAGSVGAAPSRIPHNWPYTVCLHLCRMGVLQAWATALAGHAAAVARKQGGQGENPTTHASCGILLSRSALRTLLRALARVLLVLQAGDRIAALGRVVAPGPVQGQGQGGVAGGPSDSHPFRASPAVTYASCSHALVHSSGVLRVVKAFMAWLLMAPEAQAGESHETGRPAGREGEGVEEAGAEAGVGTENLAEEALGPQGALLGDCVTLLEVLLQQ